jgi:hypothetical protein
MGPLSNARLKKYRIDSGECIDMQAAKDFIRSACVARWIEETDMRRGVAIEGHVTGLWILRYGISEEHSSASAGSGATSVTRQNASTILVESLVSSETFEVTHEE